MSDLITLDAVEENQILIWDDVEQAFVNVTPSSEILNIDDVTHSPLSPNNNIIESISDNVISTRGIVGGENVNITQTSSDIIIDVVIEENTDAETLDGNPIQAFVLKNDLNSLIDIQSIQDSLDVYNKTDSHDVFMETNASNIPDLDNVYDLGSNGRRYADVYAETFHGKATNAAYADTLRKNNANDNDVLTWLDSDNAWVPKPYGSIPLENIDDVNITNVTENDVLIYNGNSWINIPNSGNSLDFSNAGQGQEIFINIVENTVRLRSIIGGDAVSVTTDENSIFVDISEQTVVDAVENAIVDVDTSSFPSIFDIDTSSNNTMLVWEDGLIVNKPITTSSDGDGIDTSNATQGQILSYDGTNLVFIDPKLSLDDLSVIGASDGYYVAYNESSFELRELPTASDSDSLSEVDTSTANTGDVLTWDGLNYILQTIDDSDSLLEIDTTNASSGYYVAYNGSGYELRELPEGNTSGDNDTLGDVDTSSASSGDVLVWDGTQYTLQGIETLSGLDTSGIDTGYYVTYNGSEFTFESLPTLTDTLAEIDTSNASDGYYVAYNGNGYELRDLPSGTTDTLGEVDTSTATDGDLLVWNGSQYLLQNLTTLDDVDLTSASNGQVLTYENGEFTLADVSITDSLAEVDTSTAVSGDVLTWDGSQYNLNSLPATDLSLNDLNDVNITSPEIDQVLTWNGTEFVLSTSSGTGATSLGELDDVDGTVTPSGGDVLTYNDTKSQYEPLPIPTGSGGTNYEILRLQYAANGDYDSVTYLTDGIEVTNVIAVDVVEFEVTFTGYMFPPISLGYWAYVYEENLYRFLNATTNFNKIRVGGNGTSGSPTLFDPTVAEYTMTLSASTGETRASASTDFPPEPTHVYIVFVMGE